LKGGLVCTGNRLSGGTRSGKRVKQKKAKTISTEGNEDNEGTEFERRLRPAEGRTPERRHALRRHADTFPRSPFPPDTSPEGGLACTGNGAQWRHAVGKRMKQKKAKTISTEGNEDNEGTEFERRLKPPEGGTTERRHALRRPADTFPPPPAFAFVGLNH
jgi:hypothetical protein